LIPERNRNAAGGSRLWHLKLLGNYFKPGDSALTAGSGRAVKTVKHGNNNDIFFFLKSMKFPSIRSDIGRRFL
jgi:hypothetical protein